MSSGNPVLSNTSHGNPESLEDMSLNVSWTVEGSESASASDGEEEIDMMGPAPVMASTASPKLSWEATGDPTPHV